jgi:RTX calcium-binding nonapeptide repeat (4 copies)/Beta-propeller repeat
MQRFLNDLFGSKTGTIRNRKDKSSRRDLTKRRKAWLQIEQLEARKVPALIAQGPAIEVVYNGSNRADQTVAHADDGRFVMTWVDSHKEVYARVYQEDGTPRTDPIHVGKTTSDFEDAPRVAMNGSGEFVVAWTFPFTEPDIATGYQVWDYDVYAQRFTAEGAPLGGITYVGTSSQEERTPSVAIDAAGNFVVAYEFASGATSEVRDVRIARFDTQGSLLGSSAIAASDRPEFAPSIAMDAVGNFVVAYTYEYLSIIGSRDLDVHAQRFAADGSPRGDAFAVAGAGSDDEFEPAVAMNADGQFVVAYTADRSQTSLSAPLSILTSSDVFAVPYNADGTHADGTPEIFSSSVRVADDAVNEFHPAVAIGANGGFVVAYNHGGSYRPDFIDPNAVELILMRQLTPTGQPQPGAVRFTLTPPLPWSQYQYSAAVSVNRSGDVVAVYSYLAPVPGGLPTPRVFAQRFHTHGYRIELGWPAGVQDVKLTNGESYSLPVTIYRDHGYTGDVSLSGLFPINGVYATISPSDPFYPQVETRTITFTAALGLRTDGPAQGSLLAYGDDPSSPDISVPVNFRLTAGRVTDVYTNGAPTGSLDKGSTASVYGAGFLPGSVVEFGGGVRATPTYINQDGTFLTVLIPNSAQSGWVTVITPTGAQLKSLINYRIEAGRITHLSTLSGDAPEELRDGTSVTLIGAGFTPGARVQFGVPGVLSPAFQATAYFVSSDGDELSVRVPRLAVDGPLTVITDNGAITSTESFTVNNYRNTNGFNFHNPSFNISFPMVRDVFGYRQTNITIPNPFGDDFVTPIPSPHALLFTAILASVFDSQGGCFGMAYTSEYLQHHPEQINANYGLPGGAAPTVFNLVPNGELMAQIERNHLLQASAEVMNYWLSWAGSHDAASTRDMLRDLLRQGENPLISIRNGSNISNGHVVSAYDIEDDSDGYDILVYDSNREYQTADVSDPSAPGSLISQSERAHPAWHEAQENYSRIHVHGNEWAYIMAGGEVWHGGFGTLMVLPYGNVPTNPTIPTSLSGLATMLFGSLDAAPRLSVSDGGGLTVNGFLLDEASPNSVNFAATEAGGVEVTLNGETTRFAAGEITDIQFYGGAGSDTINIPATLAGVPVTVYVGGGDVTLNVASLSSLGADLTIVGGAGRENLNINDRAAAGHAYTLTADAIARDGAGTIHFERIDRVNLMGGSGADTFDVRATALGTEITIDAGPGDDTVNVVGGGGGQGNVTIGSDTLDSVPGLLNVRGGAGVNALIVNDSATTAPATWTRSANRVIRERTDGATLFRTQIDHANIQNVTINAGHSVNTLRGMQSAGDPAALSMILPVGGVGEEDSMAMALDAAGNIYMSAYFQGAIDVDPSAGETNLTAVGLWDSFLAKYSPTGSLLWARQFNGGAGGEAYLSDIKIDAAGNVYAPGYFSGSLTLGPTTLISDGKSDGFLVKLDPSGNAIWSSHLASEGEDYFSELTLDAAGNAYVTGQFEKGATLGGVALSNLGATEGFIAKVNSAGAVQWVRTNSGSGLSNSWRITADAAGNLYMAGSFTKTMQMGSRTLTSAGDVDGYLAKLDGRGRVLWVQQFGGAEQDYIQDVAVDAAGNVYLAGAFRATMTVGAKTLTSNGLVDEFIVKLNSGGKILWSRSMGGAQLDVPGGLAVDAAGNTYFTGWFIGAGTIEGKTSTATTFTGYLGKLDAAGNTIWTQVWGNGKGGAWGYGVSLGQDGQIYVVGGIDGRSDQDPGAGTFNMTSAGSWDAAVYRFTEAGPMSFTVPPRFGGASYQVRVAGGDVQIVDTATGAVLRSRPVGDTTAVVIVGAKSVNTKLTIDASAASVPVTYTGGSGGDALVGPNLDNTWTVSGVNAGKVGNVTFTNVESLVGGSLADKFIIKPSGRLDGSIDAGPGDDQLDLSAYTTAVKVNLKLGAATNVNGGIRGFENVLGGAGNDLLVGNAEANILQGGGGRDVIIGGFGADKLLGGRGDDILIGSATIYDRNATALDAILTEWSSNRTYATRVANIRRGVKKISLIGAILADNAANNLTGDAETDWFFGALDEITDENRMETVG